MAVRRSQIRLPILACQRQLLKHWKHRYFPVVQVRKQRKLTATISFAIPFFVIPCQACVPAFLLQLMTHPQAPPPLCRASAGSGTPLCTFPSSAGLGCGAQRLLEAGEVRLQVEKCSKSTGVITVITITPDEFGEPWSISGRT